LAADFAGNADCEEIGQPEEDLSRFRGMMKTPRLAAWFVDFVHLDTAQLAARSVILRIFREL
jgi:hypothetical protein